MNGYLIPANSKKGTLIFSIFRKVDLALFSFGVTITLALLAIIPTENIVAVSFALLPAITCGLLVMPVPNYHNVMCALSSIYNFYTGRRRFIWKGWCSYEQFKEGKPE